MATSPRAGRGANASRPSGHTDSDAPWSHHRYIVGYHGCDRETARKVVMGQDRLLPSANAYDWLGRGIYFWEYGPERALQWAQEMKARQQHLLAQGKIERLLIKHPAVLGAYIQLGRCFDLADVDATHQLAQAHPRWVAGVQRRGEEPPTNKRAHPGDHDLLLRDGDCALINWYMKGMDVDAGQGQPYYQTVRGVFVEGRPVYSGSGLYEKTHTQVAVRDQRAIIGYFIPTGGQP
jgi:hypothetical protein